MNRDLIRAFEFVSKKYLKKYKKFPNIKNILFTNKWNIVISEKNIVGMAFNFTGEHYIYKQNIDVEKIKFYNNFISKSLSAFVEYLLKYENIQDRAFILASINAMSQELLIDEVQNNNLDYTYNNSMDFIKDEFVVTVVGYGMLIDKLQGRCKELNIVDKREELCLRTLVLDGDIHYEPADINFYKDISEGNLTEKTDVLILTGSTLVNGTYERIISGCKNLKEIGIFGPSAQILPEYLYSEGFNYIISKSIIDTDKYLKSIFNPLNSKYSKNEYMCMYSLYKKGRL